MGSALQLAAVPPQRKSRSPAPLSPEAVVHAEGRKAPAGSQVEFRGPRTVTVQNLEDEAGGYCMSEVGYDVESNLRSI